MRKIDENSENPIDHLFLLISEQLCPIFYSLNFNANGITTLSLIFGLISLYYLYNGKVAMFMIGYIISYFFDCMDGHYARKYGCVSKFGDYYDHIKDILVVFGVIVTVFLRYNLSIKTMIITSIIISILTILMFSHLGCQEILYSNEGESPSLEGMKKLCPDDKGKSIKYTRYFGCGTYTVLIVIIVYIICKDTFKNKL